MTEQELRGFVKTIASEVTIPFSDISVFETASMQEAYKIKTGFLGLSKRTEYRAKKCIKEVRHDLHGWILTSYFHEEAKIKKSNHCETESRKSKNDHYYILESSGELSVHVVKSQIYLNHLNSENSSAETKIEVFPMSFMLPTNTKH